MGKYYYTMMWLTIGIISAIDVYWSIVNQSVLWEMEQNPIGRYLIEKDGGSIALFMAIKVGGTIIALGVLVFLYHWKQKYAWPTITILTLAQLSLLSYLNNGYVVKNKELKEHFKWQSTNINVKPVGIPSKKKSR
tara:strand:+ start:99 stop:503 length:405 start_codon:yes stop_codon:yes gene_type:complete